MARMKCKCGYNLSNSESPNDIQLRVYTDREWDKILDCEMVEPWKIPIPNYDVWLCPNCKRVYVFKGGHNNPVVVYNIEE